MKRQTVLCLMIILLCAAGGVAQSRRQRPSSTSRSNTVNDIRQVDFLNFTYHSSLCSQEFVRDGIGKTVRVRRGEFKNKDVYFGVDKRMVYGDVTGDGREDAVVSIGCAERMANFGFSEIYLYAIQAGRATLLAEINDKDMERDYRRSYPDAELFWGITNSGVKVRNGNLEIEVFADGSHATPQYIVTLEYRLSNGTFSLNRRPQRRAFRQ